MEDTVIRNIPKSCSLIEQKSQEIGFSMSSDRHVGSLLRTLVSSKPEGRFLELGTGTGQALSWIVDGMDQGSTVVSVENDVELSEMAKMFYKDDDRVAITCQDGTHWLHEYTGEPFDMVFADAWPGKFSEIEETLNLLGIGGFYVIDDMNPSPDWPEGHQAKVDALIAYLDRRKDMNLTKLNWSTGLILAVKIKTA